MIGRVALFVALFSSARADVQVPAFTAYALPSPGGFHTVEPGGLRGWNDPATTVNWYGNFKHTGTLRARVRLKVLRPDVTGFTLTIGDETRQVDADQADGMNDVDFGEFTLDDTGYVGISLQAITGTPGPLADVEMLTLAGPATRDAHFNLKERRNAASVHLFYPTPAEAEIDAMYAEVTAVTDPAATFYMACGWHRGYFGMQVNSPTERRIIFSVWDSGNEGVDRSKVADKDRVVLVDKGPDVYTGDFGNEGTGGHSHLKTMWPTGEPQRFLLTAKRDDDTHTTFAGYYFHPATKQWMLISAWRAPKEGGYLRGLHGFSENFGGDSGHLVRKSLHGNQWYRTTDGEWHEILAAGFSHDPTGQQDRLDRWMGVEGGQFFLQHGGFVEGFTEYGKRFERPATGERPDVDDILLRASPSR